MTTDPSTFTLSTTSLKLNTAQDLAPHIVSLTEPAAPTTIKTVNFSGNTLGVPACQHFATILPRLTSLQHANLADIFTGRLLDEIPAALDALLQALLHLKDLRTVNLSDNAFGLNTQAPLVKFLERATALRHLILNNNGLGPEAGTLIANSLARLADAKRKAEDPEHQAPLETIVCGRNRLENGSMAAWAKALEAHGKGLREIRMVQNGIRQEGIQLLLREGLRHCEQLRTLDLQDNTFTWVGARAMKEVVAQWKEIRELGLSDSLLSARGMVLVCEGMRAAGCEKLEVLRLQYNEIDTKGLRALIAAVRADALPALRRVELNGNVLAEEDPGIDELREILQGRRDEAGKEEADEDDQWGLDELDELEEPDSEAEEDLIEERQADDDREEREKGEGELKQADQAENENVAQTKDEELDALADRLGKTL